MKNSVKNLKLFEKKTLVYFSLCKVEPAEPFSFQGAEARAKNRAVPKHYRCSLKCQKSKSVQNVTPISGDGWVRILNGVKSDRWSIGSKNRPS